MDWLEERYDRLKRTFEFLLGADRDGRRPRPVLGTDRGHLDGSDYEQLATRLGLEERPVENDVVRSVVDEVDAVSTNGKALIRSFRIVDEDGVFEYVRETPNSSLHGLLESGGFLETFLQSEALNDSIEGLNTRGGFLGYHWNPDHPRVDEREFEWYHPLFVDGYVAWILARGGAYDRYAGSNAEAKALGRQFEREIVGDRYESFRAWRLPEIQWSEWFVGIPHWDETLILADLDGKLLWLFMFTSTD